MYDAIYRDEMKVLDSMASIYGKYKLEYIFITEMEEGASQGFLKRNFDEYNNTKMLYGMDDFISGLHNLKDYGLKKGINGSEDSNPHKFKQTSLYSIIDSNGEILYMNENRYMILKDSAFLNTLKALTPKQDYNILN